MIHINAQLGSKSLKTPTKSDAVLVRPKQSQERVLLKCANALSSQLESYFIESLESWKLMFTVLLSFAASLAFPSFSSLLRECQFSSAAQAEYAEACMEFV